VFEVDANVDFAGADVDGGFVVNGECTVQVSIAEMNFGDTLVAGCDVRDVDGGVAIGKIDVGLVAGVFERAFQGAVGDGDLCVVGMHKTWLDETFGDANLETANLKRLGQSTVVNHVSWYVDLELWNGEVADNVGRDLNLS